MGNTTKLYKLTNKNGQTYNNTQWGEGVTHTAPGTGKLCTAGWLHAYTDPYIAVLLNPVHANFVHPQLWEAEGEVGITEYDLKVGCTTLTTLRTIPLPILTTEQRVHIAVRCALEVYHEPTFVVWANNWISGEDRSRETAQATQAAEAAAWATKAAAWVAPEAAARAAARAAVWAATQAATQAAYAAAESAVQAVPTAQGNSILRNIIYSVVHPGA